MSFIKNFFGKKEEPVKSIDEFWQWFEKKEKGFYRALKDGRGIERRFFNKISPKLDELREGFYFVAGIEEDQTAELIITADGVIKNFVFVEELIASSPKIDGWKFTALKPALDIEDVTIEMAGFSFSGKNLCFYANEIPEAPDQIDITVTHIDLTEENKGILTTGIYIFLDNYLGELDFATKIDQLAIISKEEGEKEWVPIAKLKDFLNWRQKEFVEKYEGVWQQTEKGNYGVLEATLQNGNPLLAIINKDILEWDAKASHPWIMVVEIPYDGDKNGMPEKETYQLLDEIEDKISAQLKDDDGYLNLGRQTANCERAVFFACKDFRKPSEVLDQILREYEKQLEVKFDIFKDKYWQLMDRFR